MTHRQANAAPVVAYRAWRPSQRLAPSELARLELANWVRLDALQRGDANSALALDWAMQIAIWNQVAERLGRGQAEMAPVLTLGFLLAQRARDTGRWCLQGADEYEMARQAVLIMDQLARLIDRDLLQGEREALQQTREALGLYSSQRPPIELARGLK